MFTNNFYIKQRQKFNHTNQTNNSFTMEAQWLKQNWPNMRAIDVNWGMERYSYPQNVRNYIFTNWIKVSNNGGGTYCEKNYYNSLPNNHPYKIH